ncbi:unnamed protein product [Chrysodeixis includens]|uniref:unspecific monooxygenase n=1 Tax=Chrysodeixis includens TaxID=689277 RepID=A0A9N8KVP0_CHRIL|nr:unnamed protein product [Chrysodeixis includens]
MAALVVFVFLVTVLVSILHYIFQRKFRYWQKRNVPYVKPLPLLGNYAKYMLQKQYIGQTVQELCKQHPDQSYFGAFYGTKPILVVNSPEIAKDVFTKDFYYFNGRELSDYVGSELASLNLFFAHGDRWKVIRQNLTTLFSSSKMKKMFYLLEKCNHTLEDMLARETSIDKVLETRDLGARYTMDCICSCAFGVDSMAMSKEPNNVFKTVAGQLSEASTSRGLKMVIRDVWPGIFYGLKMQLFPPTIDEFFSKLLKGVFESRNHKPSPRNDFVDLVLMFKSQVHLIGDSISNPKTGKDAKIKLKVDDDFLLAQCIMFFAAGFETSSTTISFTLYELAKHPAEQDKIIAEVDEYVSRQKNKLEYECVHELPYLDAAVYETLRLYPILGAISREVMNDYKFADGVQVGRGLRVHIPIYHFHHNPAYFPDPETFKPERFLPENKKDVKPYTYFPYGEGPRICIGSRFAKMQVMAGLITILKEYRVELANDMPETLTLDARTIFTAPRDQGLNVKFIRREGSEQRKWVRT